MLPYLPKTAKSYNDEPGLVAGTYLNHRYAIMRSELGHLCGYIEVPTESPAFGVSYFDLDFSVHGGLTYGRHAEGPLSGYWIGFNCAHSGDWVPGRSKLPEQIPDSAYRNIDYVRAECFKLIDQLIKYKPTTKVLLRQELLQVVEKFKEEEEYPDWKDTVAALWL